MVSFQFSDCHPKRKRLLLQFLGRNCNGSVSWLGCLLRHDTGDSRIGVGSKMKHQDGVTGIPLAEHLAAIGILDVYIRTEGTHTSSYH